MTDKTKSMIRHILTAIGFLLGALGLADAAGAVEFLIADLNNIWDAVLVLSGAVITVVGFFKNKERFVQK